ncbi:hypothetical protein MGSAQ_000588 [marine sediment metagenome]|uniref:Uncharacterized protein n=1 Tax=marine sediment metagenome TaxID=412755 RepID=A0A1B6NWT4_9ZZZZ
MSPTAFEKLHSNAAPCQKHYQFISVIDITRLILKS